MGDFPIDVQMWPAVWSRIWPARLVFQPKRTLMVSGASAPSATRFRKHFGFRPFRARDESLLVGWLSQRVGSFNSEAEALKLAAYDHLRSWRIEPPAPERLRRLLGMTVRQREERFVEETFTQLSSQTRAALDALVKRQMPERLGIGQNDHGITPNECSRRTAVGRNAHGAFDLRALDQTLHLPTFRKSP